MKDHALSKEKNVTNANKTQIRFSLLDHFSSTAYTTHMHFIFYNAHDLINKHINYLILNKFTQTSPHNLNTARDNSTHTFINNNKTS